VKEGIYEVPAKIAVDSQRAIDNNFGSLGLYLRTLIVSMEAEREAKMASAIAAIGGSVDRVS